MSIKAGNILHNKLITSTTTRLIAILQNPD